MVVSALKRPVCPQPGISRRIRRKSQIIYKCLEIRPSVTFVHMGITGGRGTTCVKFPEPLLRASGKVLTQWFCTGSENYACRLLVRKNPWFHPGANGCILWETLLKFCLPMEQGCVLFIFISSNLEQDQIHIQYMRTGNWITRNVEREGFPLTFGPAGNNQF